ncbi:MAG: hypothetical protein IJ927_04120, partial [Eubacterium sp.]|nr:hypothetical protein [Eubacterium sp.]
MSEENKRGSKRAALIIIAIILLIIGCSVLAYRLYTDYTAEQGQQEISSIAASTTQIEVEKAENPIDFNSLQKKNSDIYAWIKVGGTKVDYPIVQSPETDEMYLKHIG